MAVKLKDDTAKMEEYPMKWLNGIQVFILCFSSISECKSQLHTLSGKREIKFGSKFHS